MHVVYSTLMTFTNLAKCVKFRHIGRPDTHSSFDERVLIKCHSHLTSGILLDGRSVADSAYVNSCLKKHGPLPVDSVWFTPSTSGIEIKGSRPLLDMRGIESQGEPNQLPRSSAMRRVFPLDFPREIISEVVVKMPFEFSSRERMAVTVSVLLCC